MAKQIIVINSIGGSCICIPLISIDNTLPAVISLSTLKDRLHRLEGIPDEYQSWTCDGRKIDSEDQLKTALRDENDFVSLRCSLRPCCVGGKGGFGSLLRSAKSVKKTTNFGSCRDLSGRRMRDVENERRLAEWVRRAQQREEERLTNEQRKNEKKRKRETYERKMGDDELNKSRKNIIENVANSVEKGLAILKMKVEEKKIEQEKKELDMVWGSDSDEEDEILITNDNNNTNEVVDNSITYNNSNNEDVPESKNVIISEGHIIIQSNELVITNSSPNVESIEVKIIEQLKEEDSGSKKTCEQSQSVSLNDYLDVSELEKLGLEILKAELVRLGLKCSGNLKQRAQRLWMTKGLTPEQYDPSLFPDQKQNKKNNKRRKLK